MSFCPLIKDKCKEEECEWWCGYCNDSPGCWVTWIPGIQRNL